jgi:hypothetical protein
MHCKNAKLKTQRIQSIGEEPGVIQSVMCKLKMQSPLAQSEIYGKLFDLGLEGSMIGDVCPVAEAGKWKECPYFK